MKKVITLVIVALIAIFGATQADAWFIDVTPIGGAAHLDEANGNSFTQVEIGFNADTGGNTLGTYVFSLLFDSAEISWTSATTTPPSGLFELYGSPYESPAGTIRNFNGASFGGDVSMSGRYVLATANFSISSPVGDGINDVIIDLSQAGTDGFTVDGAWHQIDQVNVNYPSVPVVPEPISSTLFLIGGATLGFRRFVRRKK